MDIDLGSTLALRAELEERNIELKVEGQDLALKVPSGKLHPVLRDAVITHKQALIQLLQGKSTGAFAADSAPRLGQAIEPLPHSPKELPCPPESKRESKPGEEGPVSDVLDQPLTALFQTTKSHKIWSRLLDEAILFVADGKEPQNPENLILYYEYELRQLAGKSPAQIRAIHLTKKIMNGDLLPSKKGVPHTNGTASHPST